MNFLKDQPCEVALLDVETPELNRMGGEEMKLIYPNINIIFSANYDHYRGVAFSLHASGYLTKPILPEVAPTVPTVSCWVFCLKMSRATRRI